MRNLLLITTACLFLTANPVCAQERQWSIDQNDKEAYLVFGVPESDDVGVSFWCKLQSGIITFYAPDIDANLKIAGNVRFTIEVPPKSFHLKGKTSVNQEAGSISMETNLKITDRIFRNLQSADHFTVKAGTAKQTYPLQDADFTSFLAVCKTP